MTREEAWRRTKGYLYDVLSGEEADEIIEALEQEPCGDVISREAVEDKLLRLCNELEGIFSDIREKNVDDSVCGLCEYDCDHGLDGFANECPGFETDECFKLADEIRHEWQSTKDLPSVQPKTGHWIVDSATSSQIGIHGKKTFSYEVHCDKCGWKWTYTTDRKDSLPSKFCPNCGAKMEGEEAE